MKALFNSRVGVSAITLIRCLVYWSLFLILLYLSDPVSPILGEKFTRLTYGVYAVLSALLITWLFLKYDKLSFKEIVLAWEAGTVSRFTNGFIIGLAIFAIILIALLLLTPLQIQRNTKPFENSALLVYLAFFPISLMEEIAFRSYTFIKLHQRFGLMTTQIIIAIVFALYHVIHGQSVYSSFLGPGVYAFVFGVARVWSGGIAMPFGIHFALNILQPLTGFRGSNGAIWIISQKNNITAGQMTSPETVGRLLQIIVLLVAIILTEFYIRKNGNKPDFKSTCLP